MALLDKLKANMTKDMGKNKNTTSQYIATNPLLPISSTKNPVVQNFLVVYFKATLSMVNLDKGNKKHPIMK